MESLTTSFSAPGARVLLLAPAAVSPSPAHGREADDGAAMNAACAAIRAVDRDVHTLVLDPHPDTAPTSSRPYRADLVTGAADAVAPAPDPDSTGADPAAVDARERVDLVLVSLPPRTAATVSLDRLALLAAARLRSGGILAVYTHSDWNQGHLLDTTGAVIAAAQNADLLYLQHIVTLHTPIRDGQLRAAPTPAAVADYDVARHRATVRGLPVPHLRAHGDVLVFVQPGEFGAVQAHDGEPGAGDRQ